MDDTKGSNDEIVNPRERQWWEIPRQSLYGTIDSSKELSSTVIASYRSYEDASITWIKGAVNRAKEHQTTSIGIISLSTLLALRGPRRFLLRHTLGRFRSEEAQFVKAEKKVNDFNLSANILKKESQKLLQRVDLAEKEMKRGFAELMVSSKNIQTLAKSIYKAEGKAEDLIENLREIPGKEAIKLRAEVASIMSLMKKERGGLEKKVVRICEKSAPLL